jgi:hypothetical protein
LGAPVEFEKNRSQMFFSAYLLSDLVFRRVPRVLTDAGVVALLWVRKMDGGRFDRGYLCGHG